MGLKKLCSKCGKVIEYKSGVYRCSTCEINNVDKRLNNSYYNRYKRDIQSQNFYNSKEWKHIRQLILSRDLGLCVPCRKAGLITHSRLVHHIIELKEDRAKGLEPINLITVCEGCHNKIHSDYKKNKEAKQEELTSLINTSIY